MTLVEYLYNHVFTEIRPSPIHGVGTFACRDIEVGEKLFVPWPNKTELFELERKQFHQLPEYVQRLCVKNYQIQRNSPTITIGLHEGCYFNLSNPMAFCNTMQSNGNISSYNGIVKKPIKKDEEILGTYPLNYIITTGGTMISDEKLG